MKQKKRIAILGSTGSIGRSALSVIAEHPDRFDVRYLTAHRNTALLQEQIARFRPRGVVLLEETQASLIRQAANGVVEVSSGEKGLEEVVAREDVDIVINALVGFAGLRPTLCAIRAGKDVALANKETLVAAGETVMREAREHKVRLVPIDSEHSAILQCLQGEQVKDVRRLILTASGGPFLHLDQKHFAAVTKAQALAHPTWKMGSKITIDSATLMNKGLEVIEACWLFGLPVERVSVVIHPQSVIHSMVEFVDGSVKAQLGMPDMRIPIQYALTFPERLPTNCAAVNFATLGQMTFFEPDLRKFRCLALAYKAMGMGGTAPAVLNAANEVTVQMFLDEKLPFPAIPEVIEEVLSGHTPVHQATVDDIVRIDKEARRSARRLCTEVVHVP